jgi:hypothetical protein
LNRRECKDPSAALPHTKERGLLGLIFIHDSHHEVSSVLRKWPEPMECAGRAQRRRRFGPRGDRWFWRTTGRDLRQSGVALRLPPHSIMSGISRTSQSRTDSCELRIRMRPSRPQQPRLCRSLRNPPGAVVRAARCGQDGRAPLNTYGASRTAALRNLREGEDRAWPYLGLSALQSVRILARREDFSKNVGARPSWPQQRGIHPSLQPKPKRVQNQNRCGQDGRAPMELRFAALGSLSSLRLSQLPF